MPSIPDRVCPAGINSVQAFKKTFYFFSGRGENMPKGIEGWNAAT
jgi:hypothetical protein